MFEDSESTESLLHSLDLQIYQLEYEYIETCDDVSMMEKIIQVLRSGQEGIFPHLIQFAENRLREICPTNNMILLYKPALHVHNLDVEEKNEIMEDLAEWMEIMADQEEETLTIPMLRKPEPPIRNSSSSKDYQKELKENAEKYQSEGNELQSSLCIEKLKHVKIS